jgi:hypothetical protein
MRHDVFDDTVWTTATREVRDDCERAARDKGSIRETAEVLIPRTCHDLAPHPVDNRLFWQRGVVGVQVCVERQQLAQVACVETSNQHVTPTPPRVVATNPRTG